MTSKDTSIKSNKSAKVVKGGKGAKSGKAVKVAKPSKVVKQTKVAAAVVPDKAVGTVNEVKTEEVPVSLTDSFTNLLAQLQVMRGQLTGVTGQVRALQKRSDRELKIAQKASKKAKRKTGNRAPSGFVKPTKISLELATFLGKEKGTEMARTEVTREINGYIRLHNLQDPKNGRIILADESLRKLLKLGDKDELTYFNLQRYMSPHFAKKDTKLAEAN